jgi:hypothetical protein
LVDNRYDFGTMRVGEGLQTLRISRFFVMASIWQYHRRMVSRTQSFAPLVPSGRFLTRKNNRFDLRMIRLDAYSHAAVDFDSKLRLLSHLDEYSREGFNAVLLGIDDVDSCIDLCSLVNLYGFVELRVDAVEVADRRELRQAIMRVQGCVRTLAGRPALSGFVIDCKSESALASRNSHKVIQGLAALLDSVRETADGRLLVSVRSGLDISESALSNGDLIYLSAGQHSLAEILRAIETARKLARPRPVIAELSGRYAVNNSIIETLFTAEISGVVCRRESVISRVRPIMETRAAG